MSNWEWRIIIVVPAASKSVAESAARAINSTGPEYTGQAFNIPLSASGAEAPTHWALYTSATNEMIQAMAHILPTIDGVMYWRHDVNGLLVASNVTEGAGVPWGWDESIAAVGLRVVKEPMP